MRLLLALVTAGLLPVCAFAAEPSHQHPLMNDIKRAAQAPVKKAPAKKAVSASPIASVAAKPVKGAARKNCGSVCQYVKAMDIMHRDMMVPYSGDADIDFTRGMIPHHQGAVDMVKVLRKYGKDAELRKLAEQIVTWQTVEIGEMKRWLAGHDTAGLKVKGGEKAIAEYQAAMEKMHHGMNVSYTGNADVDFVRGMIPHHQGAIDMAKVVKKYGRDRFISKLADDVIRSQQQEIRIMQKWLVDAHAVPKTLPKPKHKH